MEIRSRNTLCVGYIKSAVGVYTQQYVKKVNGKGEKILHMFLSANASITLKYPWAGGILGFLEIWLATAAGCIFSSADLQVRK